MREYDEVEDTTVRGRGWVPMVFVALPTNNKK